MASVPYADVRKGRGGRKIIERESVSYAGSHRESCLNITPFVMGRVEHRISFGICPAVRKAGDILKPVAVSCCSSSGMQHVLTPRLRAEEEGRRFGQVACCRQQGAFLTRRPGVHETARIFKAPRLPQRRTGRFFAFSFVNLKDGFSCPVRRADPGNLPPLSSDRSPPTLPFTL